MTTAAPRYPAERAGEQKWSRPGGGLIGFVADAAPMTDAHPPFRLDTGGSEVAFHDEEGGERCESTS